MIWKQVVGFPDYQVSDAGTVKRVINQYKQPIDKPITKTQNPVNKYDKVILQRNGKGSTQWVHQLVAKAFLGKPKPGEDHVNHKNGRKGDNSLPNLEWITRSANMRHAYDTGLIKKVKFDPL